MVYCVFLKQIQVPLGLIADDETYAARILDVLRSNGVQVARRISSAEEGLLDCVVASDLRYWALAASPERVDRLHRNIGHASTVDYIFTSFCFEPEASPG